MIIISRQTIMKISVKFIVLILVLKNVTHCLPSRSKRDEEPPSLDDLLDGQECPKPRILGGIEVEQGDWKFMVRFFIISFYYDAQQSNCFLFSVFKKLNFQKTGAYNTQIRWQRFSVVWRHLDNRPARAHSRSLLLGYVLG